MNTVEFSPWRFERAAGEMARIDSGAPIDRIVLYSQQEWEYTIFKYFDDLVNYSDKHNIPFYIVPSTSSYVAPLYDTADSRFRNVTIQHWGTYFLSDLLSYLAVTNDYLTVNPETYTYPFISMNSKPHVHRSLMMDTLAKYNVIDEGAISWLETPYENEVIKEGMLTSVSRGYRYKYWTPVIKKLTERSEEVFNYYHVPAEYLHAFAQLVVESSTDNQQVSEKTWMPVLYKKPFLTLAARNHHALLQDYGLLLYDELFDYSFDSEPDSALRAESIARNFQRLVNMSRSERDSLYTRMLPKIEHNYNLATDMATDINRIPGVVLEAAKDHTNMYCSRNVIDFIKSKK